MAYGIEIYNPSNIIKIDDIYSRYGIVQTGYMSTPGPVTVSPTQSQPPLVFVRPNAYGTRWRVGLSDTNSFEAYSGLYNGTPQIGLEYALSVPLAFKAMTDSGYGFRVRNSAGQVTFDSFTKYLNIDYVVAFSIQSYDQQFYMAAPPFGRRFVAMLGPNVTRLVASGTYMTSYAMCMTLNSEGHITVGETAFVTNNMFFALPSYSLTGMTSILISGYL